MAVKIHNFRTFFAIFEIAFIDSFQSVVLSTGFNDNEKDFEMLCTAYFILIEIALLHENP